MKKEQLDVTPFSEFLPIFYEQPEFLELAKVLGEENVKKSKQMFDSFLEVVYKIVGCDAYKIGLYNGEVKDNKAYEEQLKQSELINNIYKMFKDEQKTKNNSDK